MQNLNNEMKIIVYVMKIKRQIENGSVASISS